MARRSMTDSSTSDPAARLEAALERIALLAARPPAPPKPAADPALAAQLDNLILQLREALNEEEAADGPGQP